MSITKIVLLSILVLLIIVGFIFRAPLKQIYQIVWNTQCDGQVVYVDGSIEGAEKPTPARCKIFVYDDGIYATYRLTLGDEEQDFKSLWTIKDDGVYIEGLLGAYTPIMFDELQKKNPPQKKMILGNIPGSLDDDVVMPTIMRIYDAGYATHLTATSHVTSGGTDFFTAGVKRTFESGAKVGIHSWDDGMEGGKEGKDYPKDSDEHKKYLDQYRHTGIADEFYWMTLESAPADGMYYLTDDEIRKYLVTP